MGWEDPDHDIMGDIAEYVKMAKNYTTLSSNFSHDPYESVTEAKMPGAQFYLLARGPYSGGKTMFMASGGTADMVVHHAAYTEPISKHTMWTAPTDSKYHITLSAIKPFSNTHAVLTAIDDPTNSTLSERMANQILQAMGQGYYSTDAKAVLMEAIGKVMALKS